MDIDQIYLVRSALPYVLLIQYHGQITKSQVRYEQ